MSVDEDIEKLVEAMSNKSSASGALTSLADALPELIVDIRKYNPLKSASCIAALLCNPDYQSNCYRLEWLLHLCVAYGGGTAIPSPKTLSSWFEAIGVQTSYLEDPAESVFVDVIKTPHGNFRILEGLWTFGTYCTQRILNALIKIADPNAAEDLLPAILALLKLSDEVCSRMKLDRFLLGEDIGQDRLKLSDAKKAKASRKHLKFTDAELEILGIDVRDLAHFGFVPGYRQNLKTQNVGHTDLERYPLAHESGETILINPTAVCASIRRYIFEEFHSRNMEQYLSRILREEYQHHLNELTLFGGGKRLEIPLGTVNKCYAGGGIRKVDVGRYLGRIILVDDFSGFSDEGLNGGHPEPEKFTKVIEEIASELISSVRKEDPDGDILVFVTFCGIGRNAAIAFPSIEDGRVRINGISAADYETLAKDAVFNEKEIWRTVDALDALSQQQVSVMNINGILNLVGWMRGQDGHIIPPNRFDYDYQGGALMFNFDSNAMREFRHSVLTQNDEHYAEFIDGTMFAVRRFGDSFFDEDNDSFVYATTEWTGDSGVHIFVPGQHMNWWGEVSVPEDAITRFFVQKSELLKTWLPCIAKTFENLIPKLQRQHVLVSLNFEASSIPQERPDPSKRGEISDCFEVTLEQENRTVGVNVSESFELFLHDGSNIAEVGLLRSIIEGLTQIYALDISEAEQEKILDNIVPNTLARQTHAFSVQEFRDVMLPVTPSKLRVSKIDDSRSAFSLGWKVRDRTQGNQIEGKEECTTYLNSVCGYMLNHVATQLRQYDRKSFVTKCVQIYEASVKDRTNWRRTAAANINLRQDKRAAQDTIAEREFENTRILLGTRALIEMGICECPLEGGKECGDIDLGRLISDVMQAISIGGMSDAIHWQVTPPLVKITGFGSIEIDFSFYENVMFPYIKKGTDLTIESEVSKYEGHTDEPEEAKPIETLIAPEFLEAFKEHFGFEVNDFRDFCEAVEDLGVERQEIVFEITLSDLIAEVMQKASLDKSIVERLVKRLCLFPRETWKHYPKGFFASDTHPWRYRRQLSILQRPLFQISESDDPLIIVSPGILRESLYYQLRSLHEGTFAKRQLSPKMRAWKTQVESSIGHEFELDVSKRLKENGWKTKHGRKLTEIFGKKLERNFGDIDVLAWNEQIGRVLIIECKDLQHKKTPGEIAEQMSDFQGETTAKGKPDLLLKHLLRLRKLRQSPEQLAKYLKLEMPLHIEGLVAFRHPVPMIYALDRFKEETAIATYSDLLDL